MSTILFALKMACAWAVLHQHAIMFAIGAWALAATFINRAWAKPTSSAPAWKRVLHFLIADWPAIVASKNGKTFGRFTIAVPFLTLSTIVDAVASEKKIEEPTVKVRTGASLRALLPWVALPLLLSLAGCPAAVKLVKDEKAQCGDKVKALVPVAEAALMEATSSAGAMAIIVAAVQALPEAIDAAYCVIEVAVADLKAKQAANGATAAPAQPSQIRSLLAEPAPPDPLGNAIARGEELLAQRAAAQKALGK